MKAIEAGKDTKKKKLPDFRAGDTSQNLSPSYGRG